MGLASGKEITGNRVGVRGMIKEVIGGRRGCGVGGKRKD